MGFSVEELELLRVHNPNVGDIAPKYRKDTQYIYGIKVSPVRGGGGQQKKRLRNTDSEVSILMWRKERQF